MPMSGGEKARIEKRMRRERIVIPIVCAAAVAAFIIVCAVLGKKDSGSGYKEAETTFTPAPTEDPCFPLMRNMAQELGGSCTEGDGFASVSFVSEVDGKSVIVSSHTDSGIVCMQLARSFVPERNVKETSAPAATESIFVIDMTDEPKTVGTPVPAAVEYEIEPYAEEICRCIGHLVSGGVTASVSEEIASALRSFADGSSKKASIVFGVYLLELSYSKDDSMLKMKCEPI